MSSSPILFLFKILLLFIESFFSNSFFTEWTYVIILEPLFDALRVEVMFFVTGQRSDFIVFLEI